MFILDATVRARLGQFTVDEAHLAVEWGVDFRTAYQDISTMRARLPMHTVFVALSASVEPGRQFESCLTTMGFRQGRYHLEKRDCERHNVALVMRTINYTSSTYEFRDLDWLIPETLTKASDVLKRIVFCQAIELGHRLVIYLRKLLPIHIRHLAHKLIRHHHSLNCPDCKSEGLTSIYKVNEDRDCAVHVSTDVLSVGVDIPDLPEVVIFGTLSSLSALVQRAGRPARERGSFGRAIIYVKKTDIAEARKYVASEDGELDVRLLHEKDPGSHLLLSDVVEGVEPEQSVEAESDISDDEDHNKEVGDVIAPAQPPTNKSQSKAKKKSSKSRQKAVTKPSSLSPPGKRTCLSLTLVIAAYVRHLCLTRQINIIFKNPGMLKDCGRCSSCIGDHNIPAPRPLQLIPAPSASLPSACETLLPDPGLTPLPGYMKLLVKDADKVAKEIAIAARSLRWKTYPRLDDTLLIGSRSFLLPNMIKKITHNFFALTAIDVLRDRMDGWRYWSQYGELLWEAVKTLVDEYRGIVIKRHEQSLEKQRRKRTLNVLLSAGLDQVKRVTLRLPASPGGEGPPSRFPMASTSAHTTAPIGSIDTIQQTPSSTLLPKDVNALVGSKRKSASDNSQQNSKRRKASKVCRFFSYCLFLFSTHKISRQ